MDETLLAFDFGERRVGVAVGQSLLNTARPLTPLTVPTAQLIAAISPLVDEWQPTRFVVGRPTHPDGATHVMTAKCERFARQLAARFRRPVTLVDERYSSVDAQSRVRANVGGASRRALSSLDSAAAAILLERYFESHA